MKVLKANQQQYEAIEGYTNGPNVIHFRKDADNNWILGLNVLSDPNFSEIHGQLEALERIDWNPPPAVD